MKNITFLTEEQLENFIYENSEHIHELGLPKMYKNLIRQFRLPTNKIIDLFNYEIVDDVLYFRIIELKKDNIFLDAISQIVGYFGTCGNLVRNDVFKSFNYELILIGSIVPNSVFSVTNIISGLRIFTYSFDFTGLRFIEKSDYQIRTQISQDWSDIFCDTLIKGDITDDLGFMKSDVDELQSDQFVNEQQLEIK